MAAEPFVTKTYYVWLFASKDEFAEMLVAKLIRRGFTVGPLGRQLITTHEDNPSHAIAMSLYRIPKNDAERKEYNAMGLYDEVTDVVKTIKGKFWGIAVSASADATWNIGNESIKAQEKEITEDKSRVN
jgi:hypothetical protein